MKNLLRISYDTVFVKLTKMLDLTGTNSFKKGYHKREAVLTLFDIFCYLIGTLYSVWYFRADFLNVTIVLVPSVYGIQVIEKLFRINYFIEIILFYREC